MKRNQETYARNLHRQLSDAFAPNASDTSLSVAGAGVNWRCAAQRENRSCVVHCFDCYDIKGPEYLVSFDSDQHCRAMGRTSTQAEVVDSIKDWLEGRETSDLYARFRFVDRQKRSLEQIAIEVIAARPELKQVTHNLRPLVSDLYELWFHGINRSCKVSYYGRKIHPDAVFHWDGCRLFGFPVSDVSHFALVLKRWLCDCAVPSAMQRDFPSLEMSKASKYYEEGRGIEGEFIESWDQIEEFYKRMNFPSTALVQAFVVNLRKNGYDSKLRAGQSMFTLVLSRSRRHGLRKGQPHISFHFREERMEVCLSNLHVRTISVPQIMLNADVEALLKELETAAID